jgi:hypothetical protein
MSVIKLSPKVWTDILIKIEIDHGKAAVLIRDVMRRELGFTSRYHKFWQPSDGLNVYDGHGDYVTEVHLDFYDDAKETMFRLKYL